MKSKHIVKRGSLKKRACRHDYKNAIKVGNVDYQCSLCGKLLDPNEWFLMNSFEFIDVETKE
ncbi:MAG: hypothetical protein WCK61_04930 [Candidatus Omnitrophota bacterium]